MGKIAKTLLTTTIIVGIFYLFTKSSPIEAVAKESKGLQSNQIDSSELSILVDAHWISDALVLPTSDSLFYLNNPAPIFRKEFLAKDNIKSATLYITAAGYYKATINGADLKENILDPAWTDFSKRIYVARYDVMNLLEEEGNCIGVSLGNGFYNPLPLRMWGRRNLREHLSVGKPAFIAKLILTYENGETDEFVSDTSWKYTYGPIQKNSVYIGVAYDARREIPRWNRSNFNDASWQKASIEKGPGGQLEEAFFPPVTISESISPKSITAIAKHKYIVDMGVNFTGTYKIKMSGHKDDTISFRFGERLYEDGTLNTMTAVTGQIKKPGLGGPGAPDIAWQTDTYIMGDNSPILFQPQFTYHTYRYMEISGLKSKPSLEDIKGLSMHSAVKQRSKFTSSSEMLNAIQEMTQRTFLANLISVQSDCPAREKFGYGGDLNATSEAYISNFDMQMFYRKTIYDWLDAMNHSTFVDTAPSVGLQYCGISWESAFLTTQYNLFLYYNDTSFIKMLYPISKQWMQKAARIHPQGMVEKGLSDHESLEPVPVQLIGTSHYLQCAEIMQTFASLMNDSKAEKSYQVLADKLRNQLRKRFWETPIKDPINRQTLFSTLLYHNVIPQHQISEGIDALEEALVNGPSGHFNTGIFGTKYMLETLSRHISVDRVYDIVQSKTYPGWGFMIERGATTIWETWKESDNTYSNCHPMFGSVSEWFYRWLGGIQVLPEHPGFKKFKLTPNIPEGLDHVETSYSSPFGMIVSNWYKNAQNEVKFEFEIPAGTVAFVTLPSLPSLENVILKDGKFLDAESIPGYLAGSFELSEGNYQINLSSE